MHNILVKCDNCDGLKTLYAKVECSILYMMHRKHAINIYNLGDIFDETRYKNLIKYKRILEKKMFDNTYPSTKILTSQLIARISELAFKDENCSSCEDCFPEL